MIFPDVRVSDLRRDVAAKRDFFERSQADLKRAIRRKFSLINILKEHPQIWMGAAFSLLSATGVGKLVGLAGAARNGHSKLKKSGLLGTLLRFGGRTAVRTVLPMALSAIKLAFKSAFKSRRDRKDD